MSTFEHLEGHPVDARAAGDEQASLGRRLLAEVLGTGLLVLAVVGSGIMAASLSPADTGLQLLQNAAATGGALVALILMFGPVSGAHFNPLVSITTRLLGGLSTGDTVLYIGAQVVGACLGAITANVIFDLDVVSWSTTERATTPHALSEVIATVGLLLLIFGLVRSGRAHSVAYAVGLWIGGAYWFTSSTSFANPAVTIGRMLSDTFAGIDPSSVPTFIGAQLVGLAIAYGLIRYLYPHDLSEG